MRAVVDTNILVSALMRRAGPPGQVMAAVKRGELVPVFSASFPAGLRVRFMSAREWVEG